MADIYKKYTPMQTDRMIIKLVEFDLEIVDSYIHNFEEGYLKGLDRLRKLYKELKMNKLKKEDEDKYYDYLLNFQDEESELKKIRDLCYLLSIVGLYSIVENNIKKISKLIYEQSVVNTFFNFNELISQLKHDKVCELKRLKSYQNINELRLINNCIKHSDSKVSKQLAKYHTNGWVEKEKIVECKNFFKTPERMMPEILLYISEFADNVSAKKKQLGKVKISALYPKKKKK